VADDEAIERSEVYVDVVLFLLNVMISFALILTVSALSVQENNPEQIDVQDALRGILPDGAASRLGSSLFRHVGGDASIVFSPNGKILAAGGSDAVIHLWDATIGKKLRLIGNHRTTDMSLIFQPDGKRLFSGGRGDPVRMWDVANGKELLSLDLPAGYFGAFSISPDGKVLATGTNERISWSAGEAIREENGAYDIRLWDVATGQEIRRLYEHHWDGHSKDEGAGITALAFSPDGKYLISAGSFEPIRVWDVLLAKEALQIGTPNSSSRALALSPDGMTIASGGAGNSVYLWEMRTGKELARLSGHRGPISAIAFSLDGETVASGSLDFTVRLWQVKTARHLHALKGHKHWITALCFSRDGKTVLTGSWKDSLRFWDVATGEEVRQQEGHKSAVLALGFSPEGKSLVSLGYDQTLRHWDLASRRELSVDRISCPDIQCGAFSLDTANFAIADTKTRILLRHSGTVVDLDRMSVDKEIFSLAVSPDGKTVASGHQGGCVLREASTGKVLCEFEDDGFVSALAFSPHGKTIASGSAASVSIRDGGGAELGGRKTSGVKLWDSLTGRLLRRFLDCDAQIEPRAGLQCGISAIAFSANGMLLAFAASDKSIRLCDIPSGRELLCLTGQENAITCLSFSPDSRFLASGKEDTSILIWDVDPTSDKPLEILWKELLQGRTYIAYTAFCSLRRARDTAPSYLGRQFELSMGEQGDVKALIDKLDHDLPQVRDEAAAKLKEIGPRAAPSLRSFDKVAKSVESLRIVEEALLALEDPKVQSADAIRRSHAILILGWIGTDDAKKVLKEISQGSPINRERSEARQALERLR
jgi:WD40 repeat protein